MGRGAPNGEGEASPAYGTRNMILSRGAYGSRGGAFGGSGGSYGGGSSMPFNPNAEQEGEGFRPMPYPSGGYSGSGSGGYSGSSSGGYSGSGYGSGSYSSGGSSTGYSSGSSTGSA